MTTKLAEGLRSQRRSGQPSDKQVLVVSRPKARSMLESLPLLDRGWVREIARMTEAASQVRLEVIVQADLGQVFYQVGRELVTRCPFHRPDHHPSLHVNIEKQLAFCAPCKWGGGVLAYLHRRYRCSARGILRHLRRLEGAAGPLRVFHPSPETLRRPHRTQAVRSSSQERAVYSYRDEDGYELHQVVRSPGKRFLWRHRSPSGAWVWNGEGVRRVVYRLNALQGLTWVVILEGEKDADAVWQVGVPATTNPGGAGKWRQAFSTQLRNAGVTEVTIVPDNDAAGLAHADQVAASCRTAGLRVRVVRLPDGCKDVSDWLAAGHTGRDLRRLLGRCAATIRSAAWRQLNLPLWVRWLDRARPWAR